MSDKTYFIAHRGNINGINTLKENSPDYVNEALSQGYDVLVDVWFVKSKWYLGNNYPQYNIKLDFLRNKKIWCHAKNIDALEEMLKYNCYYEEIIGEYAKPGIHCFWHQVDSYAITSRGFIMTYLHNKSIDNAICILLDDDIEINTNLKNFKGVCSNYIEKYNDVFN